MTVIVQVIVNSTIWVPVPLTAANQILIQNIKAENAIRVPCRKEEAKFDAYKTEKQNHILRQQDTFQASKNNFKKSKGGQWNVMKEVSLKLRVVAVSIVTVKAKVKPEAKSMSLNVNCWLLCLHLHFKCLLNLHLKRMHTVYSIHNFISIDQNNNPM